MNALAELSNLLSRMKRSTVAVDADVLVALLTRRDGEQHARTCALFRMAYEVTAPMSVMLETCQVLEGLGYSRSAIAQGLSLLLGLPNFRLSPGDRMPSAMAYYRNGIDLLDAMHIAECGHSFPFLTFDERLIRQAGDLQIWTPVREVPRLR